MHLCLWLLGRRPSLLAHLAWLGTHSASRFELCFFFLFRLLSFSLFSLLSMTQSFRSHVCLAVMADGHFFSPILQRAALKELLYGGSCLASSASPLLSRDYSLARQKGRSDYSLYNKHIPFVEGSRAE